MPIASKKTCVVSPNNGGEPVADARKLGRKGNPALGLVLLTPASKPLNYIFKKIRFVKR